MDELSLSHWDDVVTSSVNYADVLNENGFQSDRDDEDSREDSREDMDYREEYQAEQVEQVNKPEQAYDSIETDKILSSLTNDLELDEPQRISSNDNLFNNIEVSIEEPTETVTSPVRKTTTKIMYKPARFRRSLPSAQTVGSENIDGPLQLKEDDEDSIQFPLSSPLRRDKLINSVDKPLFEIKDLKTPQKQAKEVQIEPEIKIELPEYKFDISVGDPHKIGNELLNAHIQYSVTTKSNFPIFADIGEMVVERRYNDFAWLYNQLTYSHPGVIIPPLPEKQAVGRFNENFIENRRLSLERMLIKICGNLVLQKDQDLIMFLSSDKFNDEAKYREHNVEMDDDSSLISSITGAFSTAPKFVEQDIFFIDKALYIDSLDSSLKNLYKSFESIIGTRTDLVTSIEEFIKNLKKISELEINNEINLIYLNFEELISKQRDNIERFSMNEMLTIGSTIEEYIRIIQSIRLVFQQREKLITTLQNNELLLNKKSKNLSKFKLKFHNQLEKIQKYEAEISNLEKMIDEDKDKKVKLVDTIKLELKIFDKTRLDEFKNSFEIYWESLIESQKEIIEIWETFYDNCKF